MFGFFAEAETASIAVDNIVSSIMSACIEMKPLCPPVEVDRQSTYI